jgi:peptidoglycan L-alanyl-D-glutamate endopeptidase CwlK
VDPRSEANLAGVHPDLAKVIRATSQAQAFIVIHGLRTDAEEAANVARGVSQTMHSRHLPNADGVACAVDVMAMSQGHCDWSAPPYRMIWIEVQRAAQAAGVPLEWGGDWKTLKDLGHFQLPWAQYP